MHQNNNNKKIKEEANLWLKKEDLLPSYVDSWQP